MCDKFYLQRCARIDYNERICIIIKVTIDALVLVRVIDLSSPIGLVLPASIAFVRLGGLSGRLAFVGKRMLVGGWVWSLAFVGVVGWVWSRGWLSVFLVAVWLAGGVVLRCNSLEICIPGGMSLVPLPLFWFLK